MRIPHPPHLRDTLLAKRWTQAELLSAGLVDEVVDGDRLMHAAVERAVKEGAKVGAGAWGTIKVSYGTVMTR
jgi:enoyl-CoA hydratase/carnithine racemase